MAEVVLLDTDPLVALADRREGCHQWASAQLHRMHEPMVTCGTVLAEAGFPWLSLVRAATPENSTLRIYQIGRRAVGQISSLALTVCPEKKSASGARRSASFAKAAISSGLSEG